MPHHLQSQLSPGVIEDLERAHARQRALGLDPLAGTIFDQTGAGALQYSQQAARECELAAHGLVTRIPLVPLGPSPQAVASRTPADISPPQAPMYPPACSAGLPPVYRPTSAAAPVEPAATDSSARLRQIGRQLDSQAEVLEEQSEFSRADELRRLADEVRQQARMLQAETLYR